MENHASLIRLIGDFFSTVGSLIKTPFLYSNMKCTFVGHLRYPPIPTLDLSVFLLLFYLIFLLVVRPPLNGSTTKKPLIFCLYGYGYGFIAKLTIHTYAYII